MMMCDVCGSEGYYPIYDRFGSWRYSINCPECFGSKFAEAAAEVEPIGLPPESTAARIRSMDELRAYIGKGDGG